MYLKSIRQPQILAIAGLGLLLLSSVSGATYYVGTNGSDSNPGTQASPFRHLSQGAAVARAGDTVIVLDGTYDNEGVVSPGYVVTLYYSGTAGNPITFKAQNRGNAILDAMNTTTDTSCNGAYSYFNLYNASYIVIDGFVIQRGCNEGIHSNDSAHDITIRHNEIRNIANHLATDQIGRDGIYINSTQYNFTFDGNVWHDIGRTGGITPLHFDHGIYSHGQNLTIVNNIFYNMNRGWSIQLADGASNWLVANNTFAFGNADGEDGQIMFWGNNPNIVLQNNIFYYPNNYALTRYAATTTGGIFDHNIVYPVSGVIADSSGFSITSNQTGSTPDPKFVNASGYDFHSQSGGAGIDSGTNLAAVSSDLDGAVRPQGSSTDNGAYEYGTSQTLMPPPVISSVFTSGILSNSATVNWSTDEAATSYVQYGLSSYTNTTPVDATMLNQHSVILSSLSAGTLYHFRVGSTNSAGSTTLSADSTFTTVAAPATGSSISVAAAASSLSVAPGKSATDGITATLTSGPAVAISFSTSALPPGVTSTFSPSGCTATCATTLTLYTTSATPIGTYNIVVTAAGSGASSSTTISLKVKRGGSRP